MTKSRSASIVRYQEIMSMKKYIATAIAVMGAAVTVNAQTQPQTVNFAPRMQAHYMSLAHSPDGLSLFQGLTYGAARYTSAGICNALDLIAQPLAYANTTFPNGWSIVLGMGGQKLRTANGIFEITPNGIYGATASAINIYNVVPFGTSAMLGNHYNGGYFNSYSMETNTSLLDTRFSFPPSVGVNQFVYSTNAANSLIGMVNKTQTGVSVLQQADAALLYDFVADPLAIPQVLLSHSNVMSPNGAVLVSVYDGKTAGTWVIVCHGVVSKLEIARFTIDQPNDIYLLTAAMPDNKTFIIGQPNRLFVLDVVAKTVSSIDAISVAPGRFFSALSVPKTGSIVSMLLTETLNGVSDPQLVWYDLATRKVTYRREAHTNTVFSTVVLPNGTKVFSAGKDGKLLEYGADLKFARVLGRSTKPINRLAASPDSTMVAAAQADQFVRVYTIATGAQKFALRAHAGQVTGVAFSPDSKLMATTGYDGYCRIYDTATGRQTRVFPKQRYGVTSVIWLSNTRLATGGWNEVKIWNLTATSGTVAATLPDQFGYVLSLAVSKAKQTDLVTAKYLASGGWDGWVTCYDLGNANTKVLEQWAHTDQINSVAFTADDARLLTASDDSLMGEWDHVNGLFVDYYVHNHTLPVTSLAVSPTTGLKYYSWADGTLVSAF